MRITRQSIFVLICSIACSLPAQSQSSDFAGFTLELPDGWYDASQLDIQENLTRYDIGDDEIAELMKTHRGSIPVHIYLKHDPSQHAGIIPTIQVLIRPNNARNLEEFTQMMERSLDQMDEVMTNLTINQNLATVTVGNHEGVYLITEFDMSYAGETQRVRSWTYAIPFSKYFFQINFSDIPSDDCSELYKGVLEKIRF